ncbi:MAG: ribonuclease III [Rhodothermales bacterium]|nr:ribonuclease III [Rhodothermales bacterium]
MASFRTKLDRLLLRARPLWTRLQARLPRSHRRPAPAAPPPEASVSREAVEELLGMPVADLALFERALRHRSVLRGQPNSHLRSNERLEFLGDAVLGAVVAERLYETFPDRDEGFLTRTRAKLVSGPALATYAEALGLGPLLLLSSNMEGAEGRSNPSILADAFEAVLGALYLDQGFEAARAFVAALIDEHVDLTEVAEQRSNFKSLLLEYVQARGWGQPVYRIAAEEGPSHARTFTMEVLVVDRVLGQGQARSKKQAEQQAAREALARLREETGLAGSTDGSPDGTTAPPTAEPADGSKP